MCVCVCERAGGGGWGLRGEGEKEKRREIHSILITVWSWFDLRYFVEKSHYGPKYTKYSCKSSSPSALGRRTCIRTRFTNVFCHHHRHHHHHHHHQNWKPISSPLHTDLSFFCTSSVMHVFVVRVWVCARVCLRVCDDMSVSFCLCKRSELFRDGAP